MERNQNAEERILSSQINRKISVYVNRSHWKLFCFPIAIENFPLRPDPFQESERRLNQSWLRRKGCRNTVNKASFQVGEQLVNFRKSSLIASGWAVRRTVFAPISWASKRLWIIERGSDREKAMTRQDLSKILVVQMQSRLDRVAPHKQRQVGWSGARKRTKTRCA